MFGSKLKVKEFEESILQYEARPVQTGKILLYGDSLFTRTSYIFTEKHPEKGLPLIEEAIPEVLNHGFGTSSADDLLYYYGRMVRPYAPRALVLATGANDIGFGYSPAEVLQILATLIDWFQAEFPDAPIYCIKRPPAIKHKGTENRAVLHRREFNRLLEEYTAEKDGVSLLEIPAYEEALHDKDGVHLNDKGYPLFIEHLRTFFESEKLI